tara:strand:+ start:1303 stop:2166 length:864 start_codon:yes stop_codon:yes gene_type:complete
MITMNWMSILKEESKWVKELPEGKKRLLNSKPSFEVNFPELKHPSNESEIERVLDEVENNDLDDKTQNDLDKNNHKMMLDIVDEDIDNWERFIEDVDIHTIKLKMKYGRQRPYEYSDKIKSITDTDDSPSFPSGHAIEAYALAEVLGERYPDKKEELDKMAAKISRSRVQMGNHFPSDIEVGEKVGKMIAEAYLSTTKIEKWTDILSKKGDNFKREKESGLHGWFSRRGGKEGKGKKTQGGWIDCSSCGSKNGPKPCGRKDASKGRKRRCRPTCSACKTYKRRKGSR